MSWSGFKRWWREQSARAAQRRREQWQKQPDWYALAPQGAVVTRVYGDGEHDKLQRDAKRAAQHGWVAHTAAEQDSHMNRKRTLAKGVATGGIGLALFGTSRTQGQTTMQYVREQVVG